jgi:hypothetical protein
MLTGMSPWWWVILAFALGSIEMATMTFFLIWPGLAALCMAGFLVLTPNMSGELQIALFAVLSIILTFAGRYLLNKYGDGGEEGDKTLNNRAAQLIGQSAKVLEFDNGTGIVEVGGMRWRAKWTEQQVSTPGESVRIKNADTMMLFVESHT